MRTWERDFLLILLAIASGSADAWSYVSLGHAFVANMTGNTVLIGLAVFTGHDLTARLMAVACYLPGVASAAWLTRGAAPGSLWPRSISWTLLLEGGLLAGAEAGWSALHHGPLRAPIPIPLLLGVVAFAVGMQSGAMLQLRIPGVVTTYISGTWTILASELATFRARAAGEPPRVRTQLEERLLLQAGIVGVYLASAVLAGWLARFAPGAMGLVPVSAVLGTAVYGMVRQTR